MNITPNTAFNRHGYVLKYRIEGHGIPAIVIGSHIYYPRTFSQNLRDHFQMIFIDHRAFGTTQDTTALPFQLDDILDDIEALKNQLDLDKVVIIGHSIQALIALEYAKKYPDSMLGLILIASSPNAGNRVHEAADRYFQESVCPERKTALARNLRTLADDIAADPDAAFVTRMLKFGPMIWYDWTYDASALWKDVQLNPQGAAIVWGSMFADYDPKPGIERIQCPLLLALGRYDYWNPPHLWEVYRPYIHALTVRVFEQSGHTPQLEESEAFDCEVIAWAQAIQS